MNHNIPNKKFNWAVALYYFTVAALPNVFLFNVYNQNREVAQIMFNHVLILAAIFAVVSVISLLILRLITRTYEGSFVIILGGWLFFWFFEAGLRILPTNSRSLFMGIVATGLFCLAIVFRVLAEKIIKIGVGFMAIAGVVAMLFMFNAVPMFITNFPPMGTNIQIPQDFDENIPIRRTFNVDSSLDSPDIYWIHLDGAISFSSFEYHFGGSQATNRSRLVDLGFFINEAAEFVANDTVFGVPGLLSPDFYDVYLHDLFMAGQNWLRGERNSFLNDAIERDGISLANDVAPYHELFHAFLQVGYRMTMIADLHPTVYVPIDQFYRLFDPNNYYYDSVVNQEKIFAVGDGAPQNHFLIDARDLIELLSMMTPVPARWVNQVIESDLEWSLIPTHEARVDELTRNTLNLDFERQLYRALIDAHEQSATQPRLTYIVSMFSHGNSWSWINDCDDNGTNIELYPAAYEYTFTVVFNLIDLILAHNPNAIIVLQADHGLHIPRTQRALLRAGFTEEAVIHLHNSVFSAVRIPEIYGGLAAPLDPRNITRELVNRFVGQNYEMRTD